MLPRGLVHMLVYAVVRLGRCELTARTPNLEMCLEALYKSLTLGGMSIIAQCTFKGKSDRPTADQLCHAGWSCGIGAETSLFKYKVLTFFRECSDLA